MSEFKVGDKVRVKKDLKTKHYYGGHWFDCTMGRYKGYEFIVTHVIDGLYTLKDCNGKFEYYLDCEGNICWEFTDEMLELAK